METLARTDITQTTSDRMHNLVLNGLFPPEWVGSLCAGLSARRISVERGYARQIQRGQWESLFVVRAMDSRMDLASLDYRALALVPKEAQGARNYPSINAYSLEERPDSLLLQLKANDELGLLGRLLSGFSFMMLFAHEMQIETVGTQAEDTFVLRGFGGAAPASDKILRLRLTLEQMKQGS
ncbi:MAG: hypothetical protein HY042_04940 [Spirochaetia bacterium]|nr:hypothetical protein [Spirochaetia bacterium]